MVLSTEESAASLVAPVNTAKVLFTDSFAVRPEINAVDARQSLNPSGMKSGVITEPIDAKMLAELSEDLGEAMVGINEQEIELLMAERGK